MATKIGPKTVTQRDRSKALVFCIDAAHPDSYAGEPATNLIRTDVDNWSNTGTAFTTITNGGLDGKSNAYRIEDDNTGAYELVATTPSASLSANTQYTLSVWFKQKATSEDTNRPHFRWSAGDGEYMSLRWRSGIDDPVVDIGRSDGDNPSTTPTAGIWETAQDKQGNLWVRAFLSWTTQTDHSGTGAIQFYVAHDAAAGGGSSSNVGAETIWCPQLEQSAYPTPVVGPGLTAGSERSTSTAVKNISGVGALGTTLTATGTFETYGNQLRSKVGSRKVNRGTIAAGNIGGAYWDFDGSDEYIVIPYTDSDELNLTRGTIITWFKASGGGHNGTIVGWGTAGTNNFGNVAVASNWTGGYPDESFVYARYRGSAASISMYVRKGHNFYADSTWHCVAVTSHGGASDLGNVYIDGELQTVSTTSNIADAHPFMNVQDSTTKYLNIGRRPYNSGTTYFNGEVANTMIWGSSLTSKEIKDIYIAQKGRFGK
jgi:hypothetical protein